VSFYKVFRIEAAVLKARNFFPDRLKNPRENERFDFVFCDNGRIFSHSCSIEKTRDFN
jgi:hypothetical protein